MPGFEHISQSRLFRYRAMTTESVRPRGAFATLLSKPSYLPGTVVLDYSLKQVGSKYPLVIMVSADLPKECLDVLSTRGIKTVPISRLAPKIQTTAVTDERFPDTWCKLA